MSDPNQSQNPFPSLEVMRQAHRKLQHQFRRLKDDSPEAHNRAMTNVVNFVKQGVCTGTTIADEDDRWSAQGLLDFWSAILYRHEWNDIDATLQDYDADLAPEFEDHECPYFGLGTYDETEKSAFHGRLSTIKKAITRIDSESFLGILGPAGSGKSSLIRAGVIPKLKKGALDGSNDWFYLPIIAPGKTPLMNIARLFTNSDAEANRLQSAMRKDKRAMQIALDKIIPDGQRGVFTLDEFEELFYRCDDNEERFAVTQNLVHLVGKEDRQHVVIMAMLSSYERIVAQYINDLPDLYKLFQTGIVRITPPTSSELREVIEKPAADIGLRFEEDLIDRLLQDVSGEHTALPLLQFTLLRLWEQRERNLITWDAYRKVGGGREALVSSAADFYNRHARPDRLLIKHILLKLTYPNENLNVELVPATRAEILSLPGSGARIGELIDELANARLIRQTIEISTGEQQYELVHEALAQDWVQLVQWLDDERFTKRQRLRLRTAATAWVESRSPDALLRGAFLDEAEKYSDLTEIERDYLDASRQAYTAEQDKKLQDQQAKVQLAEENASLQRLNNQRLRTYLVVLGVMVTVSIAFAFMAFWQRSEAEEESARALAAESQAVIEAEARATAAAEAQIAEEEAQSSAADALAARADAEAALADAQAARAEAEAALEDARESEAEAQAAQTAALENLNLARASNLSAQAFSFQQDQIDLSLLLSLEALNLREDINTKNVLLSGLTKISQQTGLKAELTFTNHQDSLFAATYRPDGNVIASAGYDNDFILWDANSGEQLSRTNRRHTDRVRVVRFSPNGEWLITGGYDNRIMLWNVTNPSNPRLSFLSQAHTAPVSTAEFSPNGRYLVTASQAGDFVVWELVNGDQLRRLATPIAHSGPIYDVAFSPDGRRLYTAGEDGLVLVWNISRPGFPVEVEQLDAHTTAVNALALNDDNSLLATADDAGKIIIWSVNSLEPVHTVFAHSNWVLGLDFAPNSDILASASRDNSIVLWNAESGLRLAGPYFDHTDWVRDIEFSPDGSHLISAGREGDVIIWGRTQSEQLNQEIVNQPDGIDSLALLNDETLIALSNGTTYRLDLTKRDSDIELNEAWEFQIEFLTTDEDAFELSPDGRWAASAVSDTVTIWSTTDSLAPITLSDHAAPVRDFTFSYDGAHIATVACAQPIMMAFLEDEASRLDSGDAQVTNVVNEIPCAESIVTIWETASGKPIKSLPAITGELMSLAFSYDGQQLAAGGCYRDPAEMSNASADGPIQQQEVSDIKELCSEGLVLLWPNLQTDTTTEALAPAWLTRQTVDLQAHKDQVSAMVFNPNGDMLVTASEDGVLSFWDLTQNNLFDFPVPAHIGGLTHLQFSTDGATFISVGNDARLLVWDLTEYQPLPQPLFTYDDSSVTGLVLFDNDRFALSSAEDGTIIMSRANLESWREMACQTVNRNLTPTEWEEFIASESYRPTCTDINRNNG